MATGGSLASAGGAVVYNGSTSAATFVQDADIGVPVLECQKVRTHARQASVADPDARLDTVSQASMLVLL